MKGLMTILKVFATLIVIGILGATVFFLKRFQEEFAPNRSAEERTLEQIAEDNERIGFEPGQSEFNRALQLIALEKLDEAREKLLFIQNVYPDSTCGPEARRILGEINLDKILSVENMANKLIHTVQPGEGYLKIATENQTTLDAIMYLNGLLDLRALHAGDELVVMPLDFKLVINLPKSRVELFHRDQINKEHVFAKDYSIHRIGMKNLSGKRFHSQMSKKFGEINGRAYQPTNPSYQFASKVLGFSLGNRFIQLRADHSGEDDLDQTGIFLAASDMEELSMLIRIGNEVELVSAR